MSSGRGVDREYLLAKLQEFHGVHKTPDEQSIRDLNEAFVWLPKSAYETEVKPLSSGHARSIADRNGLVTCCCRC
ncbi:MAG: hypothetical protein CMJ64_17465 [Planctomycetaceae bacterium]|nr:hypothetical protein [Planctomycetaceae bacterium]